MNQFYRVAPRQLLIIIGFYLVFVLFAAIIAWQQPGMTFGTALLFAVSRPGNARPTVDGA